MKILVAALAAGFICPLTHHATAAESQRFLVIEIETHDDNRTYEVMTKTEYQALREEIQLEHRFHAQALRQARSRWRDGPDANRSFPTQGIHRRSAFVRGSSDMDLDSATKRKAELKGRLEKKDGLSARPKANSLTQSRRNVQRRKRHAFDTNVYEKKQDAFESAGRKLYVQELNALVAASKPATEVESPTPK